MTDAIIKKLYKQAVDRVTKELEAEREVRVKRYLATAIRVLVREKIIEPAEAKAAAAQYGIKPSDSVPRPEPTYSSDNGCGAQSPSPSGGNRC